MESGACLRPYCCPPSTKACLERGSTSSLRKCLDLSTRGARGKKDKRGEHLAPPAASTLSAPATPPLQACAAQPRQR